MPLLRLVRLPLDRRLTLAGAPAAAALGAAAIVLTNAPAGATAFRPRPAGALPPISILPSKGVQTKLDLHTARLIAHDLLAAVMPAGTDDTVRVWLVEGEGQGPPTAAARLADVTYSLHQTANGHWALPSTARTRIAAGPTSDALAGLRLNDVSRSVGLDFRQGSFRFGMSKETQAMMGGGVCWLDYNGDGWEDLYAVNSYASADTAQWQAHGGLPRSALFENVRGRFHNVSAQTHAGLQAQGDGCAAADLMGNGRPDLVVTTTRGVDVLWNNGDGTFTTRALPAHGWYTGVAVADVNGDGRPDVFVAGYADPSEPVPNSFAGFPTNVAGVRDLLFLNEGGRRFREVGVQAGLESALFSHGLGAEFVDVNHDGRPDLYVANDEDPNELYINVAWPGGVKADPAGLGFRFEDRAAAAGVADPFAGMGIASDLSSGGLLGLFVTNSRGEPSAVYAQTPSSGFANARRSFDPALGTAFAGWGVSWVDLANSGRPDLVLAAGAIPVTSLAADAEQPRVLAPNGLGFGRAKGVLSRLTLNGRGVAAADAANDGRMDVAINTIGGRLVLLRPTGPVGHWIDVSLSRFAPGTIVSVTLPDGRTLVRTVQAGSSYLSSEDPRVHFGLGSAQTAVVHVRYPWGATGGVDVPADRVVHMAVPPSRTPLVEAPPERCTPAQHTGSIATVWDETAVSVLRAGGASEPVQARDLFDLANAMSAAGPSPAAISSAAYRLLLWRASYLSNLGTMFALLTKKMRSLCYSPNAAGDRIAAAAIAAGRHDGSNEAIHYADPSYLPENAPLFVRQAVSTVHDATFWQPLAFSRTNVQSFVDAQWGAVRTFVKRVRVGPPPFADPSSPAYKSLAIAVLRATAGAPATRIDTSPLAWNRIAAGAATGVLARDLRLYLTLNGALNDAAVSTWAAKRKYQAPRPISMIRYLAFNNQLPLVDGVSKRVGDTVDVLSGGRWISGAAWTPPAATPASPGGVSEGSAFAYAAGEVLNALTGRSFLAETKRLATAGLAEGIETPGDEAAGRALGLKVAKLALAR